MSSFERNAGAMLLTAVLVVLGLVLTRAASAEPGATQPAGSRLPRTGSMLTTSQEIRLVLWGDSISEVGRSPRWHGGASSPEKHWGAVLAREIQAVFPQARITLIHAGIGGQNSYEGLGRLDALEALKPDLVLVAFGANDCSHHPLLPEQTYRAQVEMLERIRKFAEVVNISTAGNHPDDPKFSHVPETVAASARAAAERNVPFVNMHDAVLSATESARRWGEFHLGPMNCHPNDRGHEVWARAVARVILAEIVSTSTQPAAP